VVARRRKAVAVVAEENKEGNILQSVMYDLMRCRKGEKGKEREDRVVEWAELSTRRGETSLEELMEGYSRVNTRCNTI
jgi:hypothetical protein